MLSNRTILHCAALLSIALAGMWGCRGRTVEQYSGASVILISIDTLRADRLPLYGYARGSTPTLDDLGRKGFVFEEIYSPCPLTLPAHSSLFTGLLPPRHGVRDNIGYTLAADHPTLASRFKAAGWRTGGAISSYVLRRQTGIANGFDFYDAELEVPGGDADAFAAIQRDGNESVDALLRWIDGQPATDRLFAFLHLYEPHTPYTPPAAYKANFDPYDGEIAYADAQVGRFLGRLESSGRLDKAIVVVVSDHGEGLNDHGEAEHGVFLYREALRVPLIVRLPGGAGGGRRIAGAAGLADVASTLLDLANVPSGSMDGVSLRAAMSEGEIGARPIYAETLYPRLHFGWSDLYAVTQGPYRFIRAPRAEVYDIRADPGEKKNLATPPAAIEPMRRWLEAQIGSAGVKAPSDVPPDVRERLQALGYVGSVRAPDTAPGELPDPKDTIASYEAFKRALKLRDDGQTAQAIGEFRRLLDLNPGMLDAWEMLGATLIKDGKTNEGIAALERVLALNPTKPETHLALARVHALDGRTARAVQHAELAAPNAPAEAHEMLAQLMMDQQRPDRAADHARQSIAADPGRVMGHFILGTLAHRSGRWAEAVPSLRAAESAMRLQKQRVVRNLHATLGDALARLGKEDEAEKEFLAELEAIPASREARVALAMLYRSQGRDQAVRDVLAGLVASEPQPSAETYWTVVRSLATLGDAAAAREWAAKARARYPRDARFR